MGFFFQKEGIAIPQLYLGKGEDQLLRGREALPVEFNLQMTATKSFRVTFGVRLWAEAAQAGFFCGCSLGSCCCGHCPAATRQQGGDISHEGWAVFTGLCLL